MKRALRPERGRRGRPTPVCLAVFTVIHTQKKQQAAVNTTVQDFILVSLDTLGCVRKEREKRQEHVFAGYNSEERTSLAFPAPKGTMDEVASPEALRCAALRPAKAKRKGQPIIGAAIRCPEGAMSPFLLLGTPIGHYYLRELLAFACVCLCPKLWPTGNCAGPRHRVRPEVLGKWKRVLR
uniref:Uncharacterized protein n=1 Tax=Caulerpa lentillifera TaxID=148947 RepID=A0A2Z2QKH5_9CHLO|nr:hypothetical protein [Caulerpa lentillifera]AST24247.1 hypothetical protein [Caulerpa lentillifera]QKS32234.1 hypothetical protein [Caulerpa lentillifera]